MAWTAQNFFLSEMFFSLFLGCLHSALPAIGKNNLASVPMF